jgi:hypothetical protein
VKKNPSPAPQPQFLVVKTKTGRIEATPSSKTQPIEWLKLRPVPRVASVRYVE